jgi:hypothetical protein
MNSRSRAYKRDERSVHSGVHEWRMRLRTANPTTSPIGAAALGAAALSVAIE